MRRHSLQEQRGIMDTLNGTPLRSLGAWAGWIAIGGLVWFWGGRRPIAWRKIFWLLGLHGGIAGAVVHVPQVTMVLAWVGSCLQGVMASVTKGTSFVFGYLGGGALPFDLAKGAGSSLVLMFQVLPTIIVMGALTVVLFHLGVIPGMVHFLSHRLGKWTGMGGALSTGLVSKLFLGQTDVPLVIRPYVAQLTAHEMLVLMTAGMSTSAWAVYALYSQALTPLLPQNTTMVHLMGGAVLNILASVLVVELIHPHDGVKTEGQCTQPYAHPSLVQAISHGANEGWKVMTMVAAAMIAFIALVDMLDQVVSWVLAPTGRKVTLTGIVTYGLAPLTWCMGVAWHEAVVLAQMLARKLLINEWIAIQYMLGDTVLSPKIHQAALYLITSFGNISSMGIQMACFGAFAPEKMPLIAKLVPQALVCSVLAGVFTGAVVYGWL